MVLEPGGIDHSESIQNNQTLRLRTPTLIWTSDNTLDSHPDGEELKTSISWWAVGNLYFSIVWEPYQGQALVGGWFSPLAQEPKNRLDVN